MQNQPQIRRQQRYSRTLALLLVITLGLGWGLTQPAHAATPGTVVAWGDNFYGQSSVPAGLSGVTAIAGGGFHSLALKSDGTVVAWGFNGDGQSSVPAGLSGVTAIAGDGLHSLALKSDGTVVAWGDNAFGQSSVPAGLSGVTAIAGGGLHSLALKSDGTVVAWGDNVFGQSSVPAGLSGVTAIAGGGFHSLALKSDGTVVAWGDSSSGQSSVPAGLSGVTAIAGGGFHSLALKSDGTVVAWGFNGDGQSSVPAGLSGVTAIAGGVYHSLALKSDGTVVAWGDNGYGQSSVPAGLNRVTAIAGGGYHSLALVDTIAPETTIDSGPSDPSANPNANFTFSSNEAGSTFQCQLDGGGFSACTSPQAYSGLADGPHTFQVQATDAVGNIDATPATFTWTINTAPPPQTLYQQVQAVRASLAALLPSGDSKTDKSLHKAIAKIDQALAANLWQADGNHLTLIGDDVFNRLRDAVQELAKIKNPSPAISSASSTLATIARSLAQIALDEAVAGGGDAGKIAKAQSKLSKGDAEAAKGKLAKAIAQYEDAWEYAQQALGLPVAASLDADEQPEVSDEEGAAESEAGGGTIFLPVINR